MSDHRKGNKNAAKEQKASERIQLRVTAEQREQYGAAAARDGKTLSEWMKNSLDEAAEKGREP